MNKNVHGILKVAPEMDKLNRRNIHFNLIYYEEI